MIRTITLTVFLFVLLLVAGGFYEFYKPDSKIDFVTLRVGDAIFEVEIADTFFKRSRGLADRTGLQDNQGMLFVFDKLEKHGFWMKGMEFPIDIVWIKDNQVIGIEKNVLPTSSDIYYPPEPVDRVLEINAGLADKLGIKVGDEVL